MLTILKRDAGFCHYLPDLAPICRNLLDFFGTASGLLRETGGISRRNPEEESNNSYLFSRNFIMEWS